MGLFYPDIEAFTVKQKMIFKAILGSGSLDNTHLISTHDIFGIVENKDKQFYLERVAFGQYKTIVLTLDNMEYFLENVIEKFDVIITPNYHDPFTMLLNKTAKIKGVQTFFYQHGINTVQSNSLTVNRKRLLEFWHSYEFRKKITSFPRLLLKIFFIDRRISLNVLKNVIGVGGGWVSPSNIPSEYKFSKVYVFSEKDRLRYINSGYQDKQVVIMGDLDFLEYQNYKGSIYTSEKKYILYIDDYCIERFDLYDSFNRFSDEVISKGFDFIFLQRHKIDQKVNFKRLNGKIIIAEPKSINKYLDNACVVYGTVSSLIKLPLRLGKKVELLLTREISEDPQFSMIINELESDIKLNKIFLK